MRPLRIDIALWDIKGKVLNVPIWQLLGGKVRERADVYGWIGMSYSFVAFLVFRNPFFETGNDRFWIGGDRPSDVLEQAKVRKSQGFTRIKMNVSARYGHYRPFAILVTDIMPRPQNRSDG